MSNSANPEVSQISMRELAMHADHSGTNPREVHVIIGHLLASGGSVPEICGRLAELRGGRGSDVGDVVDRNLVDRIVSGAREREQLGEQLEKIKTIVDKLLSPPLHVARYLGKSALPSGLFAIVSHGGVQSFVAFADGVDCLDFHDGDLVLLSEKRNAILGRANIDGSALGESASFVDRTDDGHLILQDRDVEVVVRAASGLTDVSLRAGDRVLWDQAARLALRKLPSKPDNGIDEIGADAPPTLGGCTELQEQIVTRFVASILYPDIARRYGLDSERFRRLLLSGPPGTGKTSLMRVVAAHLADATGQNVQVIAVNASELASPYVGVTEQNIKQCFRKAEDYDGTSIIFMDELDAVGRTRGSISGFHDDRHLNMLLAELEGLRRCNAAVIGATNRPDALDPALRGRFAWEIAIPRPDRQSAEEIFEIHLADWVMRESYRGNAMPTLGALTEVAVTRLYSPNADNMIAVLQFRDAKRREVAARELVSGRLIEQICHAARASAFEREIRGGGGGIRLQDVESATAEAIARLRTTLRPGNAKSYLSDLPDDVDVVSVEPLRPRVDAALYRR